jgi:hypothetical protein
MPALSLQQVQDRLTPWAAWSRRNDIEELSGIYIIAEFQESPPAQVDPLDQRVVCIGEAHAQTVPQRLKQFFTNSHGPGYRGVHEHGLWADNLYVSVVSPLPEPWLTESYLLDEYKVRHGRRPICNGR